MIFQLVRMLPEWRRTILTIGTKKILEVIVVLTLLICYFLDAYIKHGYLWKVPKGVPFSSQILHRPHNDNMLELMVVEVGSSEGHHQVPQTDQGAVRVGKQTNNHVPI